MYRKKRKVMYTGVSKGIGAAKTGRSWIRVGGEGEELRLAMMEGRNVGRRRAEKEVVVVVVEEEEVRHQPLIEAVDIATKNDGYNLLRNFSNVFK